MSGQIGIEEQSDIGIVDNHHCEKCKTLVGLQYIGIYSAHMLLQCYDVMCILSFSIEEIGSAWRFYYTRIESCKDQNYLRLKNDVSLNTILLECISVWFIQDSNPRLT